MKCLSSCHFVGCVPLRKVDCMAQPFLHCSMLVESWRKIETGEGRGIAHRCTGFAVDELVGFKLELSRVCEVSKVNDSYELRSGSRSYLSQTQDFSRRLPTMESAH